MLVVPSVESLLQRCLGIFVPLSPRLHVVFNCVVLAEHDSKWQVIQEKNCCLPQFVLVGVEVADLLEHD